MLNLSGKTIVLTGSTGGIGLAAAHQLVEQNAFVIGIGRSSERCRNTEEEIKNKYPQAKFTCLKADLSLLANINELKENIQNELKHNGITHLDALINNAGTFRYWLTLNAEGFEVQWSVNHLAPFYLTHQLLPLLQAAPSARVITVSSGSHYRTKLNWDDIQLRRKYNGLKAYKQVKLANVLFTAEFNRRINGNIKAFAADPGLVNTSIGAKSDSMFSRWIWNIRRRGGISPEESAKGITFLAGEEDIQDSTEIYWKHSRPKSPSKYALEKHYATRLWAISEKMCGIPDGGY
ncbi:MAG: SDR family NAD(P)-dependent oxidoreductase [Anaerolineaceae bacterium]|nr:SDR family NAD(P)-dependent oxidoreductase [Anaerolineaceae bacterium]